MISPAQIEPDWEANHPATSEYGVSVAGFDVTIATSNRDPSFADFENEVDYVVPGTMQEFKEFSSGNVPEVAHPNGSIKFLE